jgi:hypothetical protein
MTERNVGVLLTWAYVVLLFAGKKAEQLPSLVTHIPPPIQHPYMMERKGYAREELLPRYGQA